MQVLIVDDDLATRKMLRFVLEQQAGHMVEEAPDGEVARSLVAGGRFDLLIVDVMMPGIDGVELCRQVRRTSNVPIMMVSARGDIPDRVRGLRAGADDYLPKPFDASELAARVEAVLRRARRSASMDGNGALRVGELLLHLGENAVTVGHNEPIPLTPTEFRLLLRLARTPGEACDRAELARALWGAGGVGKSTINAYISELRRKLEPDPRRPRRLVTVRGSGYRLDA